MNLWDSPPLVVAASRMTGVRCYFDLDPEELTRALAPLGPIELLGPPGRQMCCELWHVTDGRVLIGGLEQQDWAMVARELGQAAGSFWGASASWAWGDRMARGAMDVTQWTVIEPYHELLFSIPDVLYPGCEEPVSVALGMATDLPLAFRLDRLSFYGFDKRMAAFSTDGRHRWDVTIDGAPLLSARFEPTGRDENDFDRATAGSGTIQPLLGGLRDRRPMLSELRRDLCASGEDVHEVEGVVELAQQLFPAVGVGHHRVSSRGAPPNRISVGFRGLDTYVTYPRSPQ